MNGVHLEGTPTTIEPRQAELEALHQEVFGKSSEAPKQAPPKGPGPDMGLSDFALVDKAREARNGHKFARLWGGDTTGYETPSEADLALCSMLAFWTGPDPARIDRLFRQSGLMREKWERQDYRDRTITKALADTTEFYSPGRGDGQGASGCGAATGGAWPEPAPLQQDERQKTAWAFAAQLFPRIPFPWEVLPSDISDSLQHLGRACATSPYALPGAAFCIVGSIMGRTLVVSPKEGWDAPLILWLMDIRESGEGKTPPVRLIARPINEAQRKEEICYREAMDAYKRLPRKERDQQPQPAPPRGYFVSDLTLEGLRDDLVNSPHGGLVVIQDEISAFLSGQNQYKSKGTDREAWLALHDGHPARIVRAGRTVYLNGARGSIFGGVQPKVFRTFFAGEDGLYLSDGTLFRFLATCEPPTYYELTKEAWEDSHRGGWEKLLFQAIDWVDGEIYAQGGKIEQSTRMILSSEAQGRFFEWRNQMYSCKDRLPAQLRGFLPKAVEYVLRLTGVINCIQMFSQGGVPGTVLSLEDLERGIKTVHFYLGQVQDALRLIENEDHVPVEISERSRLLACTLERLRPNLDNGRLAIGYIQDEYNKIAPKTKHIGSARAMGGLLRALKLTTSPEKHDANDRRGVFCLEWNCQTENFIKQQYLQHPQAEDWQDKPEIGNPISAASVTQPENSRTLRTLKKQCPRQETCDSNGSADVADIADVTTEAKPFSTSANGQEVPPGDDGNPDPGSLAGNNPGTSHNHVRCRLCQHFIKSPIKDGGDGSCGLYPKSTWDGKPFQSPDELHSCPSFDGKDSIKVLTASDEAISQRVGEALKLGNNLDFKEVEI